MYYGCSFLGILSLSSLHKSFPITAGVMLEHLHKLQSENRTMQSRIMELASQREFYIAINTRLRQTLADSTTNQIPNGLQTSGNNDSLAQPSANPALHLSSPDFHRSASGERTSLPSPSPSLPAPSSAGALSKQDQESLLHAHFLASSLPPNYHPPPPPFSQTPPHHTPTNAHYPVHSMEGPAGFRSHERSSAPHHALSPQENSPYAAHAHDSQPLHEEQPVSGMYHFPPGTNSSQMLPKPPYGPVPMAMPELDTLTREHPQSGHLQPQK